MRIAVVGTGIAGLVTAWRLADEHELTVYEAGGHVGGHTHTHDVELDGRRLAVDSGFIVFNRRNYPQFDAILEELGVPSQPSSMSFSVHCERTGFEYNGTSLNGLFAQRSNLLRPSFYGMLRDVLRFNREAPAVLDDPGCESTLGAFVERHGYGRRFVEHYLVPMGAAIWSTGPNRMRDAPMREFVRFFHNHGMLTVDDRPEWRVVQGGSRRYVEAMTAGFADRIRLETPVRRVTRHAGHVAIETDRFGTERFDEVVLATHSDQALALLADPSPGEREILGALPFQPNAAVLHTDERLLPARRRAWASWNYIIPREGRPQVAITYNMNILQGLDAPATLCVTLNPSRPIDSARVLRTMTYHHPIYDTAGWRARQRWAEISGARRTHYCGAYWGDGFHEDGVVSAQRVVESVGRVGEPVGAA